MSICLVCAWKTELWDKAIDLWLFLISDIGMKLLLARVDYKGIKNRIKSEFSLLGAGAAVSVKGFENVSPSYPATSALICSIFLLSCKTFISTYWPFLFSRLIFVNNSFIQVASYAAKISAKYSASIDNKATIACLLEHQLTGHLFSMKTNPEVDFFEVWFSA